MKGINIFLVLLALLSFDLFASGAADEQSQALLFKQKRVRWDNAPESTYFYEVYLYKENDVISLLDIYSENNIKIVNLYTSMKIEVTNANDILRQNNTIYKCVVLYSNVFLGMAVVNIFEAVPLVNQSIGFIGYNKNINNIYKIEEDLDHDVFFYIYLLESGYDDYGHNNDTLYAYFPNINAFMKIGNWPPNESIVNIEIISMNDTIKNITLFIEKLNENERNNYVQNELEANIIQNNPLEGFDEYLPIHMVNEPPKFDETLIARSLVYPQIAMRSGIEGQVILELFVDNLGRVQHIHIIQENPPDRGFGEAAINVFTSIGGTPAIKDGVPVPVRYRYPISFRIR